MTLFDEMYAAAAEAIVLPLQGEMITYTPSGGSPRQIVALVHRLGLQGPDEAPSVLTPVVVIEVLDDATNGIDSATLDTGGDTVTVAVWQGQTPRVLPITVRLPNQDGGLLQLQCGG